MNPIVEFCISNLAKGSQSVFDELSNDPNIDVLDYGCLTYCGQCSESLYALVNGDIVTGDTPDLLKQNIYQHIEETWIF
ncbi:YuzB family protein [Macrococcus animalis]|uniref:YuzB family protein n=1 Tax=Macrococcus animalis TaxID=3395467 RepID=UPI0039BFCCB3